MDYSFYDQKKPVLATITNIVTFMAVCGWIYMIWGFYAALLFALSPVNVSGVAWNTGNYYMTTALFVLASYYFFQTQTLWGMGLALAFYTAALDSTVCAIPLAPFLALTYGSQAIPMLIPLTLFLTGKKFRGGLKMRKNTHNQRGLRAGFFGFLVAPKVIGYYLMLMFWPSRLGFFHSYGKAEQRNENLNKPTLLFYVCGLMIAAFIAWGIQLDWKMTLWTIFFLGLYSQIISYGQFVSERYLYIANTGFCVLMSKFLEPAPLVYASIASLWFFQAHLYVKSWRHNVNLFSQSISAFPDAEENYNNYGMYLLERDRVHEAMAPLMMGLKLSIGNKSKLNTNIAVAYDKLKKFDKALFHCREAMKDCPRDSYSQLRDFSFRLNEKAKRAGRLTRQINRI